MLRGFRAVSSALAFTHTLDKREYAIELARILRIIDEYGNYPAFL